MQNIDWGLQYCSQEKGETIFEYCAAMGMTVGNTHLMKRKSHLVKYESGPPKTRIDYCLAETD